MERIKFYDNYVEMEDINDLLYASWDELKRIIKMQQLYINNKTFEGDMIGGEKENCFIYFTSPQDKWNYIRIDYTLFECGDNIYKGIKEVKEVNYYE